MRSGFVGGTFIGFYPLSAAQLLEETPVKIFKCVVIPAIALASFGCGSQVNTNVGANQNIAVVNANKVEATAATPAVQTPSTGSLATPSDAYRTAYDMREKKDVAGLKRVMSKDILEFLTMMGEGEKKTLDDQIAEIFEKPQAKTNASRNEKISGDRATVEYPDEDGEWKTMDFVKEGQEWKMTLPKDDAEADGPPSKKAP